MKNNKRDKWNKREKWALLILIFGISLELAVVCSSIYYNIIAPPQVVSSEDAKTIILNVLNNDSDFANAESHLSDDEFCIVQEYVREHEEELKDYNPMPISKEYSIVIDKETRALYAKNNYDMTRRLTWRTIDCNDYSDYDKFVNENNRTYCIGKNVIAQYYLGKEIVKYEVPVENPIILSYHNDDIVVTDEDIENTTLLLCTKENCIQISNSFSRLPVEIYGKGLYYIDNNLKLYMYNLCTGTTTYISDNVYDIFYSSGINFRAKDGIFRINLYVSEDGEQRVENIASEKTHLKIERWAKK